MRSTSQVPGIKLVLEVFHCTPGTVDSLAEQLKAGQILVRPSILLSQTAFFYARIINLSSNC